MFRHWRFLAATSLIASPTFAQSRPTVAQFLSPSSPLSLASAKKTDRLAWPAYERGMRNVYTAAAPAFTPVRLTSWLKDDGKEAPNLILFRYQVGSESTDQRERGFEDFVNREIERQKKDGRKTITWLSTDKYAGATTDMDKSFVGGSVAAAVGLNDPVDANGKLSTSTESPIRFSSASWWKRKPPSPWFPFTPPGYS